MLASCLRSFLAHDCMSLVLVPATLYKAVQRRSGSSHRRGRQMADSRQLGFSKKLVNKHLIIERVEPLNACLHQHVLPSPPSSSMPIFSLRVTTSVIS